MKRKGFTLLEVILSLIILSVFFTIYGKWEVAMQHHHARRSVQESLPVYVNAFLHFVETSSEKWNWVTDHFGRRIAIWYALQEKETKVRTFVTEKPSTYSFQIKAIKWEKEVSQGEGERVVKKPCGVIVEFYGKFYKRPLWVLYYPMDSKHPVMVQEKEDLLKIYFENWRRKY